MLDTSGSMTLILDRVKAAAEQFLIRLLPEDEGRVGAFSDKIEFLPEDAFTSDRDRLIRLVEGTRLRLPDAALGRGRRKHPPARRRCRSARSSLVFTDGADTASRRDLDDVMEQARAKEIMVYAIGLDDRDRRRTAAAQRSSPDRGSQEARGRNRRRILPAEERG